jgi:hypothetical protein
MKTSQVRRVSYQGRLRKNDGQGVGIFITLLKEKVVMNFRSMEALENDHC